MFEGNESKAYWQSLRQGHKINIDNIRMFEDGNHIDARKGGGREIVHMKRFVEKNSIRSHTEKNINC